MKFINEGEIESADDIVMEAIQNSNESSSRNSNQIKLGALTGKK